MLVGIRHPVGIGVSLLALVSFLAFVLSSVYGDTGRTRSADPKVDRILADSAPLIASDLAILQERRRRTGLGYLPDTDALVSAWVRRFPRRERGRMRDWTGYHGVEASATGSGFTIEALSAPGRSGWYRLTVDRRAGQVVARCGGDPVPGCRAGRWRIEQYGLVRAYLLGR
jgi:hypothetical protein